MLNMPEYSFYDNQGDADNVKGLSFVDLLGDKYQELTGTEKISCQPGYFFVGNQCIGTVLSRL